MLIEMHKAHLDAEPQKSITAYYDNQIVGEFIADIVVNNTVILELKSVRRIIKAHEVQLVNYLVATGKPVGLILNFGERKVDVKRKIKDFYP
jgi:GxxExxY protein